MKDWMLIVILFTLLAVLLFCSGYISATHTESRWRTECIKRGVAEYDSVTGEWRWKRNTEVLPE
jgi:hypothetical protein